MDPNPLIYSIEFKASQELSRSMKYKSHKTVIEQNNILDFKGFLQN